MPRPYQEQLQSTIGYRLYFGRYYVFCCTKNFAFARLVYARPYGHRIYADHASARPRATVLNEQVAQDLCEANLQFAQQRE